MLVNKSIKTLVLGMVVSLSSVFALPADNQPNMDVVNELRDVFVARFNQYQAGNVGLLDSTQHLQLIGGVLAPVHVLVEQFQQHILRLPDGNILVLQQLLTRRAELLELRNTISGIRELNNRNQDLVDQCTGYIANINFLIEVPHARRRLF